MHLLLIEDEIQLNQQLHSQLTNRGYAVDAAMDGEEGLYMGLEYPIDIAVIDIGLPKLSGIEVIKQLRQKNLAFPILILTARSSWQEKVEGLDAGADDYLVKPFHIEELIARLNALQRRFSGFSEPVLDFGPIILDTKAQSVSVNQSTVELTAYEYKVLEYLALNTGKVISKAELTEHIYAQDYERDSNVMEVFVRRLRKKLDPENNLGLIKTHRGSGYSFCLTAQNHSPHAR